ncbi:SNARE domain protein [Aphelenchoides fujianensis]|nr:SNARE domain protein [Aphelenchoides fujianensis]
MDSSRGERLIDEIAANIRTLSGNVSQLEHLADKIGGPEDNNDALNRLVSSSNALSKKTSAVLKELVALSAEQRQLRVARERLVNEYMAVLNRLQSVQRRAASKEKAQIRSALNQLETDINDVNMIFKDLARIVHDQGEMVDSIEANVEHASVYVGQGHSNVQQALHYQQKARQKQVLIFLFCCALVFIIGLTIYLVGPLIPSPLVSVQNGRTMSGFSLPSSPYSLPL